MNTLKRIVILLGLLLTCVSLTGCFGLAVAHPRQKPFAQFSLGQRGVIGSGPAATNLTEAQVLELWGPPNLQQTNRAALTVWHYTGDRQCGIVAPAYFVILPLPFPAGREQVKIYFQNGIALKASRSVMVVTGVLVGMPMVLAWEKEQNPGCLNKSGEIFGCGFD